MTVAFGEPVVAPHAAACPVKGIFSMDLAPLAPLQVGGPEMTTFQLRFCPRDARTYEALIPVYLDGDMDEPYLNIEVQGVGQYPRCGRLQTTARRLVPCAGLGARRAP